MIRLDGADGEGGGQILRTALTLSILTRKPFRIQNIRANRAKPGLAAQHLACVRAAAKISQADVVGAALGSVTLEFKPRTVKSGDYTFTIGTAGATALVVQTVLLPLALGGREPSTVTITGGTHAAHAPTFEFLATTWGGYLSHLGIQATFTRVRPGFYPRGGGEIEFTVQPCTRLEPIQLLARPLLTSARGFSAVASLPVEIAERQAVRLSARLEAAGITAQIRAETWSNGPGTVASLTFEEAPVPTTFTALGARGVPAERVADEVADAAFAYLQSGAPVDAHSADQVALLAALADGASRYRVSEVTSHLRTNLAVIQKFVNRDCQIEGESGSAACVSIGPERL